MQFKWLKTLAEIFIIAARRNQFIQVNILNNAPVRWIDIAMNTNSAFTGSYTENLFAINNVISDKLEYSEEIKQM